MITSGPKRCALLEVVESWTTTVNGEIDRFIGEHNTLSSL